MPAALPGLIGLIGLPQVPESSVGPGRVRSVLNILGSSQFGYCLDRVTARERNPVQTTRKIGSGRSGTSVGSILVRDKIRPGRVNSMSL